MICHFIGYRYSMTVYLGKDRKSVPVAVTAATHSTVTGFTARVEKGCRGTVSSHLHTSLMFYILSQ